MYIVKQEYVFIYKHIYVHIRIYYLQSSAFPSYYVLLAALLVIHLHYCS